MDNIIFYTDRYKAINLLDNDIAKFVKIIPPTNAELDSFILDEIVNSFLDDKQYKNIYIPLSPFLGYTDFLGLRIALYIKVSESKNKLSNIFIYGNNVMQDFINNDCFQVLTFQEVRFIDFSKITISKTLKSDLITNEDTWFEQITRITLPVPDDYFDNHSIANEWGIYQMARNAGINIEEIEGVDLGKFKRLYFKWLIFKNKLNNPIPEMQKIEQVRYAEKLDGIKIIGTIDLSKFKKK